MTKYITKRVHELYWKEDLSCARTVLICLSELFEIAIEPQIIWLRSDCMVRVDTEHSVV